jgi:NAD(P)H dehydrogenase (quinone)
MILTTGAGGKTGQAVIRALVARQERVRALARRPDQAAVLQDSGVTDVVIEDLLDEVGMVRAMAGVQAVYLIAPNVHPEEGRIGEIAIDAARTAGVQRMVYHSVLHPQTRAMPHHWQKLAVEERLFESGLDFTILQPAAYMQNLLPYWDMPVADGRYRVPYGEGAALSLVDLEDVAEVAAQVLTTSQHSGAIYELAGPEALTPAGIAKVLSEVMGRRIEAESYSIPQWIDQAHTAGLGEYAIEALVKMFRYYDGYGLQGNPNILEWLLGRPPTRLRAFVERVVPGQ